ncbi:mitochondrial ATPase expression-domain-containing protein [Cryomyces antarcticus]
MQSQTYVHDASALDSYELDELPLDAGSGEDDAQPFSSYLQLVEDEQASDFRYDGFANEERNAIPTKKPQQMDKLTRTRERQIVGNSANALAHSRTVAQRQHRFWRMREASKLNYKEELRDALSKKDPFRLMQAFLAAAHDTDYIRNIPETTFSSILNMLQPKHLRNLARARSGLSPGAVEQFNDFASAESLLVDYLNGVKEITGVRRATGMRLSINDYRCLLACCRTVGDKDSAERLWTDMGRDNIAPDTTCYNNYLAALIWNRQYAAFASHKLRTTPLNTAARSADVLGPGYESFRVKTSSIKEEVMSIFNNMLSREIVADETTMRYVMLAMAREGDIDTVKTLLKRVWNIDADAVMKNASEPDLKTIQKVPSHSPLYPNGRLLYDIAHMFGSNNDIPAALRLVDYVSRLYSIKISQAAWSQLHEWTFVLASSRTGQNGDPTMRIGNATGQLPKASVLSLWQTFTSPPYNIRPTMPMYNQLIKNLWSRQSYARMLPYIDQGVQLHLASNRGVRRHFWKFRNAAYLHTRGLLDRVALERAKNSWEVALLTRRRNAWFVRRWVRLVLGGWWAHDGSKRWERVEIPRFVAKMEPFAPTKIFYETSGGRVAFRLRDLDTVEADHRFLAKTRDVEEAIVDEALYRPPGSYLGEE